MSPLRGENPSKPTYRIRERLGDGRGDLVYLADHDIFSVPCVQKTVRMHGLEDALASSEPGFLDRLEHPRIVPVREAQWDPAGEHAITFVMPYFPGGSVHDALISDYRFSIGQAITIAVDALDALAYLHRKWSALHRDTKPGNVVLDEDRQHGYLMDFGSAALIGADGRADAVLGTSIYRPPESRTLGRVGVDADLYGIAFMLFEMLNGRVAWETMDLQAVEARLQKGQRALPDKDFEFAPHVPERLRRCVRKALNRDPAKRFASAEGFITALRKVTTIDWRHETGGLTNGVWLGSWPPHASPAQRAEYRVTTRVLQSGKSRGQLLVESDIRRPGGDWRQAVADARLDAADRAALASVFGAVEINAAQRAPAA
jgi:eukaryotic-like serine/threonine-protein kinase